VNGNDRVLDGDPSVLAELAQGARHGFAGGAGHGCHLFVGKQQGESQSTVDVLADLVAELQEQAAKPSSNCFRQRDAAGVLQRKTILLADALHGAHLCFLVGAQEVLEAIALDGTQLGGCERLSGDFVNAVRQNRVEAQHGAGSGNAHNHLPLFAVSRCELDVAAADQIEAASFVALGEQGRLWREGDGAGCQFKIRQHLTNYYEGVTGLMGAVRSINYNGYAKAHRAVLAADYGFIWQATPWFALSDQANFSNAQDPGYSNVPIASTLATPTDTKTSTGNMTITYKGQLTSGHAQSLPHGINGYLTSNYFGQKFLTNNLTASWEPSPRTSLSLT